MHRKFIVPGRCGLVVVGCGVAGGGGLGQEGGGQQPGGRGEQFQLRGCACSGGHAAHFDVRFWTRCHCIQYQRRGATAIFWKAPSRAVAGGGGAKAGASAHGHQLRARPRTAADAERRCLWVSLCCRPLLHRFRRHRSAIIWAAKSGDMAPNY
mmetsp:Transcript_96643/g.251871  ORF Transcript_96643/g.251871 Transcript_96643/m.251871 type:complete len:153 (-) Transcript_96643:900-1358(-)